VIVIVVFDDVVVIVADHLDRNQNVVVVIINNVVVVSFDDRIDGCNKKIVKKKPRKKVEMYADRSLSAVMRSDRINPSEHHN
jgi:hypothetical protein